MTVAAWDPEAAQARGRWWDSTVGMEARLTVLADVEHRARRTIARLGAQRMLQRREAPEQAEKGTGQQVGVGGWPEGVGRWRRLSHREELQ